jgi:hypothetical protein
MFLNEVEDIFEVMDPAEFAKVQEPLFQQLAKSVASPHFQVRLMQRSEDASRTDMSCDRLPSVRFTSGTMNISAIWSVTTSRSFCQSCSLPYLRTQRATGIGMYFTFHFYDHANHYCRTIHSMVYNAMKMFMEINPQLFDECSHEYNERQNSAEMREKARQNRWEKVAERALQRQNGVNLPRNSTTAEIPLQLDDVDALTQESQRRLQSLKLDEASSKDRRPREGSITSVSHQHV